jgi:hypothetical protein
MSRSCRYEPAPPHLAAGDHAGLRRGRGRDLHLWGCVRSLDVELAEGPLNEPWSLGKEALAWLGLIVGVWVCHAVTEG